jgi:lipopolysaccharide transport system permease protein
MSAGYQDARVRLEPGTAGLRAEFTIRNESSETWQAAQGFAIGYHVFDAETGTLLVDGERVPMGRDLQPGESEAVKFSIALPAENGRYQVLISPMREGVCWYYERGWPFLLVEAETRAGLVRLGATRVADAAELRRRRELRAVGRAFVYPVLTVWRNRGLIRVMVRRDILGRYRGSFGGSFWTVINPLLLILTYYFVFALVMRASFPGDTSRSGYVLYYIAGMLPWLAFSEAAGRAPQVVLEHRNFVRKLVFAVETLPVNLVAAGLVSEFFAVLLYCAFLLLVRHGLPVTVLWLPLLLIPQVLFTAGISWFLAALGAFVRDLGQIIGFVMTIWFFMTPICYPEQSWNGLPPFARAALSKNPMYILVRGYRAIFLEHQPPAWGPLWKFTILAAAVFVLGHAWFYKLRKSFADMI